MLRKHSKMNRGRPEAIGLIHLGEACEKILKNVEIGRGLPNSKTRRGQTSNVDAN